MTPVTCVYHSGYDPVTLAPEGEACGAPADFLIIWRDGTNRWSTACADHLELEAVAPPRVIVRLPEGATVEQLQERFDSHGD